MSQNLFFSEYAEGSSNNKYLEIYNGGSETINLNIYQLVNCRNGCDSWEHFHPFNEDTALNAADVWVFCAVDANDVIRAECNQTIANNSIFNGDDVWAIQEINTSTILDKIGEIGDDPGSGWNVAGTSNATKDHTLVRKESVLSGNIDWAASAGTNTNNSEWIVLEKDDFTNLGSHTCNACGESTSTCNDSSACNFGDEGECTYPNTGYDCDGNCTVGEDCAGNILDSANCNLELIGIQPQNYKMINAYPNPFNSNTTITLQNMGNTFVKLDIIDLNGHIIDSIYSGYLYEKSTHTFLWDASENNSGIYIARISENKKIITHKIILLK